jgi:hypothetical protein
VGASRGLALEWARQVRGCTRWPAQTEPIGGDPADSLDIGGDVAVEPRRADGRGRTGDLALTMGALCQLSYVGADSLNATESALGEAACDQSTNVERDSDLPFCVTNRSANLLCQLDDDPLGAADIAESVAVPVAPQLAD